MYAICLPNNGLSDVIGIVSATIFKNTVNESRIVTPKTDDDKGLIFQKFYIKKIILYH